MPDMQSALQAALSKTVNSWAADDEAHQQIQPQQEKAVNTTATTEKPDPRITNNISRTLFEFILKNPGRNRMWVAEQLVAQGFKYVSVTSLISQMVRARMAVIDDEGGVTATLKAYEPIRPPKKPAPRKRAVAHNRTHKVREAAPEAVYTPQVYTPQVYTKVEAATPTPEGWTVESVIDELSVRQALAVYMELREIFGG